MSTHRKTTYRVYSDQLPLGEMVYGSSEARYRSHFYGGEVIEAVREERRQSSRCRREAKPDCGHKKLGFDMRSSVGRRKMDRSNVGISITV